MGRERKPLSFDCSGRRLGGTLEVSFKRATVFNGGNKEDEHESYINDEKERDNTGVMSMKDGNSFLENVRDRSISISFEPIAESSTIQENIPMDHVEERQLDCIEEENVIHEDAFKLPFDVEARNDDRSGDEKEREVSNLEQDMFSANNMVPIVQDEFSLEPSNIAVGDDLRFQEDGAVESSSRPADDATHGHDSLTPEDEEEHYDSLIKNAADTFSFGDLCPVESTNRLRASQTFYRLLQVEKKGEAISTQDVTYGSIWYSKKK